jgi:peptide/nickel transport system ATP-binding protein
MKKKLLEINDLSTIYKTETGAVLALSHVCLNIAKGENFGLVGESGCGKSTILKAIINVMPGNAEITQGEIWFDGKNLLTLPEEEMRKIRWQRISMITQSAMNSLDPVYKVGDQIYETVKVHQDISRKAFIEKMNTMFSLVGVNTKRQNEFPHQFSGGMRQRAIIAMSLILEPDLVIADEPTTSLDVIVQDQIFKNIRKLQKLLGFSMLLVTHDIALVVENCDRIGVMYGGQMMEIGSTQQVIKESLHPYTMGLKHSFPNINNLTADLISIPGSPPELKGNMKGCRFTERCPFRRQICFEYEPKLVEIFQDHWAACHRHEEVQELRKLSAKATTWTNAMNQNQ